jgi:hypothetical protein
MIPLVEICFYRGIKSFSNSLLIISADNQRTSVRSTSRKRTGMQKRWWSYLGIRCEMMMITRRGGVWWWWWYRGGGGQLLFKNGDGDDTRKDREENSRCEIQLITTEAKGELNLIQNQNNSQGERKRTKEENAMNGRTKKKHERKDRTRWDNIHWTERKKLALT